MSKSTPTTRDTFIEHVDQIRTSLEELKRIGHPDLSFPLDNLEHSLRDLEKVPKDVTYWNEYE